jgi:hypothetical protein
MVFMNAGMRQFWTGLLQNNPGTTPHGQPLAEMVRDHASRNCHKPFHTASARPGASHVFSNGISRIAAEPSNSADKTDLVPFQ